MMLKGRRALVTGGSRGIGLAVAQALARHGARVAIWSRDTGRNAMARASLPDDTLGLACDITDETQISDAMKQTVDHFGGLDICVACAGAAQSKPAPIAEFDLADWRALQTANVESALLLAKHASPYLKHSGVGRLILFSSVAAHLGIPTRAAYSASKAAIEAVMRSLAAELAHHGVLVNAIAPGYLETDMTRAAGDDLAAFFRARVPSERLGEADDAAEIVAFLASDGARYITGQTIVVDGGFSTT